ncbi:MAG: hypothetical protein IKL22_11935 [Lachnospiraceae bacterium]|nr:hypothetical protein [Lachnospiraceae bacterium]
MAKKDTVVFVLGVKEIRMKLLRASTEHEMILEFLKAESTSERFSKKLEKAMVDHGFDEEIITKADLQSELQNTQRKKLLGTFRGYGEGRELFERFPTRFTEWSLCSFSASDLEKIRYIDYSYWNELSAGTRKPMAAAETIRRGVRIFEVSNEGFLRAAEYIKDGGTFPKPFFITADYETFVIVEGHQRMTAYALVPECFEEIEVVVGKCNEEELRLWM